jgi:serine/threonine-protein kinase
VGNYAVERLVGKSGLLAVYAVRQTRTERPCLLTVFHVDPDADPWTRFRREVEQLSQLKHPSLIEVLDLGVAHDGTPYLVTEELPGEDLGQRLRLRGALTLPEALAVARQAGAALHAGHGIGVLHRDVRPANLWMVEPSPEPGPAPAPVEDEGAEPFLRVRLMGFGVMRLLEATVSGMALVGDPEYMAPEQILGNPFEVDPRADQYALAVVLYQSLTTVRPFRGDSVGATLVQVTRGNVEPLRALRPDIPPNIDAAIARAMSRDREARFPDMHEFLQALQEGVPLPIGMAELTEPWLSPPTDLEEAQRLVLAAGAEPVAPLSLGVSAALRIVVNSGPHPLPGALLEPQTEADKVAVPHAMQDVATVPVSMDAVMQLAVPPPPMAEGAGENGAGQRVPTPPQPIQAIEIVEEFTADGRPVPRAGVTEVVTRKTEMGHVLPSIIVDLPTRPVGEGEMPPGVAAPNDATRVSPLQAGLRRLAEQMERRATLAERVAWAVAGLCAGGILMRLLS